MRMNSLESVWKELKTRNKFNLLLYWNFIKRCINLGTQPNKKSQFARDEEAFKIMKHLKRARFFKLMNKYKLKIE